MRKPSDYAHAFGEQAPSHWDGIPVYDGEPVEELPVLCSMPQEATREAPAAQAEPMALATFRLLYESERICLFETRDGHITAVAVDRLV